MNEPRWLSPALLVAVHEIQLRRFGGVPGIRYPGALDSALARARNRRVEEWGDLAALGATYAFAIARHQPFVEGNRRTALLALVVFLGLNGVSFGAREADAAVIIADVASGAINEAGLARWISDNLRAAVPSVPV